MGQKELEGQVSTYYKGNKVVNYLVKVTARSMNKLEVLSKPPQQVLRLLKEYILSSRANGGNTGFCS